MIISQARMGLGHFYAKKPYTKETKVSEDTIKYRVFQWLREHEKEKPRGKIIRLCRDLGLDYEKEKQYLWFLSSLYKTDIRSGLHSKSSPVPKQHNVRAMCRVPECLDRLRFQDVDPAALEAGWVRSKNRNRTLVWDRDPIGRIEWFTSGKVRASIRKPHTMARAKTLIGRAFFELIADQKIMGAFLDSVEWGGSHDVYKNPEGKNLPYMVINNYVELLGFRLKMGDYSHRDSVEIEWVKPMVLEKLEQLHYQTMKMLALGNQAIKQNSQAIQQFSELMKDLTAPRAQVKDQHGVIV